MHPYPNIVEMVNQAEQRIRPFIRQTILEPSPFYSQIGLSDLYFKCENLQHTGSFKVRGALNKILSMSDEQRARGVVTASTGNHGAAVAYALNSVGGRGIVFVPEGAVASKVEAIRRRGVEIRVYGDDSVDAESQARAFAENEGLIYVPPYNDPHVIGGQGTIGLELIQQMETVDAVFVSVGGGGLIGGIAAYMKSVLPRVQIIGCSPENSEVMARSVEAGQILDLPSLPTLSDGTAGGVEPDSITFPLCRDLVDRFVSVSETEIAASLRQFMESHHMLIEGSAAVALAAYLKEKDQHQNQRIVIVLCGANIDLKALHWVLGK